MRRPLISDEWVREFHCPESTGFRDGIMLSPLTFCGTLEELYKTIARGWNDDTREKYDRDFNNVILPHLDHHNEKIISAYTKEDCEKAIDGIRTDGYLSRGQKKEYSETQINHFKYLIYWVFSNAVYAGYCQDFLWGTKFEINMEREELAVRSKTQIKRSLSIAQEKSLFAEIMEDPREDGKRIALLLMFSLGLRDGEACGLDFGDIYELPYYKGCYVAIIKQSTIPKTSVLQSSGKTWNSGRRIPIPQKVAEFLLERKNIVVDLIEKKNLNLDISRIPVAGDGYIDEDTIELAIRLRADKVAEEARNIFRQVGIESEVLASLEVEMEEEVARLEISEKSVTAYLLRRNFATHLKILGLDYPDIQYLLGHCIEDPYINRPDYTDSKLYALSEKMKYRPLVNENIKKEDAVPCFSEWIFPGEKKLIIENNGEAIRAKIYALEKNETLKIRVDPDDLDTKQIQCFEDYQPYEVQRTLNVIQKYRENYEKKEIRKRR